MNVWKHFAQRVVLLFVLVAAGAVVAQDASQLTKSAVMRRLVNEVYTGANFDVLASAFVPDFIWRRAGNRQVSLTDWRGELTALAAAMPDIRTRSLDLLTQGDWAASLTRLSGTFSESLDWQGNTLSPNNDEIEWLQLDIVHFQNGRAVLGYGERDTLGLTAQLGVARAGAQPVQPARAASAAVAGQAAHAGVAASAFTRDELRHFADTLDVFLATALVNPDITLLEPLFSDDFVLHFPARDGDLDSLISWLVALKMALPDGLMTTPAVLIDDDRGAARLVISGVFLGQWTEDSGVMLTGNGQQVILTANLLARFNRNGEVSEMWLVYDRGDWATQFAAAGSS